jgi:Ca-activated chloride channel family protein
MGFRHEHARLASRNGELLALERVTASGDLSGMLLDMRIEQRFRNPGATSLEVVYTFPLPWRAVLLGVDVRLGERTLTGAVVAKAQAVQGYEDALAEGDAAVMLEVNADASYSLNLGNLAPGEACVITLHYAQLLQVEQGSLRLLIPTVIAPRYGDPVRDGGLQPHQAPAHDMRARYPFDLSLRLHGDLSRAPAGSPSHPIRVTAEPGLLTVALAAQGMLDRDFILTLDRIAGDASMLCTPDTLNPEHHVMMASFCPVLPPRRDSSIAAAILVDCSGSMAGDSLSAAQCALHEVLGRMVAGDRFSLSRFGSQVEHRARHVAVQWRHPGVGPPVDQYARGRSGRHRDGKGAGIDHRAGERQRRGRAAHHRRANQRD